ncbi:MAG: dihydrodipicolinate synthase family protein [Terriglobia bacterium]|jgi:4-hydroxy-tetrahydrodipicolinate synthase
MRQQDWQGVFPAVTTPFNPDLSVNYAALRRHVSWLLDCGCRGLILLGSLGEGPTLTLPEKIEMLRQCKDQVGHRAPLVAGVSGLSTAEAVQLAQAAEAAGCDALMVLPQFVYRGDWRETETHLSAVFSATPLPCMLYNNPVSYNTDVTPPQIVALAKHPNLCAVKESSGDIRRVAAIRELLGERVAIFAGLDDTVLESVAAGAVGWVAGLANALPVESVRLFDLARAGNSVEAWRLYQWFLPLLRLDVVPKFVQLIKLVQSEIGCGSAVVRGPRLELTESEREGVLHLVRERLAQRPANLVASHRTAQSL